MKPSIFCLCFFLLYCTPKNKEEEPVTNVVEEPLGKLEIDLNGTWVAGEEIIEFQGDRLKYTYAKGTDNEGTFECKVVEFSAKSGFFAGEIKKAVMMNSDVTTAFQGDYSVFYFRDFSENTIQIDGPEGAVITGLEHIHQNDDKEHHFILFQKQ